MKPLPISIQSFRKLRQGDYAYIDKTKHIYSLARLPVSCFLSRPRRFGKSLTLETLKELFLGSRDLFEGTWIAEHWDWTKTYPVIHLLFNKLDYQSQSLEEALRKRLLEIAAEHGLTLAGDSAKDLFEKLIIRLGRQGGGAVILIDEYDKPLIDYLDKDDWPRARENQQTLKAFYSVLKGSDDYIRFLFITGVSKFSQVSVFSDLNHLQDLTMHPAYVALTGYTQAELESNFPEHIEAATKALGQSREAMLQQIRTWYNGYSWDGKTFLYNPFSILNFFDKQRFSNYWYASGTPTFLPRWLFAQKIYQVKVGWTKELAFSSFNIERLDLTTLLFQTGYLTIKEYRPADQTYCLDYPNYEVEESMLYYLFAEYSHTDPGLVAGAILEMCKAFAADDLEVVCRVVADQFKSIPYDIFIADKEAYYHAIIWLLFRLTGFFTEAETHSSDGRLDAAVTTSTHIYLFEFKLDKSPEAALQQIREKDYAARYRQAGRQVVAVGVNFSSAKKTIDDWQRVDL